MVNGLSTVSLTGCCKKTRWFWQLLSCQDHLVALHPHSLSYPRPLNPPPRNRLVIRIPVRFSSLRMSCLLPVDPYLPGNTRLPDPFTADQHSYPEPIYGWPCYQCLFIFQSFPIVHLLRIVAIAVAFCCRQLPIAL